MNIIFKDYSHITEFIDRNRGNLSEAQMAVAIKIQLDTEFASEIAYEQIMYQAKPNTILGERIIEKYGNLENFLKDLYERSPRLAILFYISLYSKKLNN